MNLKHKLPFTAAIATLFIAMTATGQVASDKKVETFLSGAAKQKLEAMHNRGQVNQQSRNGQNLPSARPLPPKAMDSKTNHAQRPGRAQPTLPESELKKRLPSNSLKPNRQQKSLPKIIPAPTPSTL